MSKEPGEQMLMLVRHCARVLFCEVIDFLS
jgi:hypothetical protein